MQNGAGVPPVEQEFALVQLKNFNGYLHAGTQYSGKITAMYSSTGFTIPDDCIVYAGYGTKAAEVQSLTTGMDVSYVCHLYTGPYTENSNGTLNSRGTLEDGAETAVNSFELLGPGRTIECIRHDTTGTDENARTVIGLTKDKKVHIITVAKPSTYFSASEGSTMKDIAKYMMTELNCTDVINMDGGGSTEMIARRAGSNSVTTVSYPSDGSSRTVSNSLLMVSDPANAAIGPVIVDQDFNIYEGRHSGFFLPTDGHIRQRDFNAGVFGSLESAKGYNRPKRKLHGSRCCRPRIRLPQQLTGYPVRQRYRF